MDKSIDKKRVWEKTLKEANISSDLRQIAEEMYFSSSKLFRINMENGQKWKVYILCDNFFVAEYMKDTFKEQLTESMINILNTDVELIFGTKNSFKKIDSETSPIPISEILKDNINPKYTFQGYVISDKNKMLVQAAQTLSLKTNLLYNPIFIHGGSGLGKTHLLHAIGNEIKQKLPSKKVRYITSEEFGDTVVNTLTRKNQEDIDELKKKYQSYDLLLIDDIQYISSREKTKEIFFTILNNNINDEKQIVITSDSSPEQLSDFEDRFITRFKNGLTLSVFPPDFETSKKIILLKLKKIHLVEEEILKNDVIEFIAFNFSNNVREIEGILNKLMFWTINNNIDVIDMEIAIEILGDINKTKKKVTVEKIKNFVSKQYNIDSKMLNNSSRKKDLVIVRHLCIYLTRELLGLPLKKISIEFGRKDHTTIMHAINNIEQRRKVDPNLNIQINKLIQDIKNN